MVVLRQFFFSSANVDLYIEHIKERIQIESDIAENEIFQVKKQFQQDQRINFTNLLEGSKYPIMIYHNKRLVYWSDHTHHVNYYDLNANYKYYAERCIETNNGVYLVKKSLITLRNQDYEVISLIPIRKRYQVENEFLRPVLNPEIFPGHRVRISVNEGSGTDIKTSYGTYLFSIIFPDDFTYHSDKRWLMLLFVGLAVLFLALQLDKYLMSLLSKNRTIRATLLLVSGLVGMRAIMLYYQIPYDYVEYQLFEPKVFASSALSPSLGDLFLNLFCLLIILVFIYSNYPKIIRYKQILRMGEWVKAAVATTCVVITYFSISFVHTIFETVYTHSRISLDVTESIAFPVVKIAFLLIFIILAIIYFFVSHIAAKVLIKLSSSIYDIPIRFVAGSLIFYLVSLLFGFEDITIFNVNAIYVLFISFLNLPLSLRRSDYSTYIYLFVCAVIVSSTGAYSIYKFGEQRKIENKSKFANSLLIENDLLGEYYLNKMVEKVEDDQSIQSRMIDGSSASIEWIVKKIKRVYLNRYFDKYNVDTWMFDKDNKPLNTNRAFNVMLTVNNKQRYKTEYQNIYFINELATGNKSYVVFIPIRRHDISLGHIVMELKLRRVIPNSIHPNFFVDKKYQVIDPENPKNNYSYAIYSDNNLLFSSGEYRYDNRFLDRFQHDIGFLKEEVVVKGYHHLLLPNDQNQNIVISSPKYPSSNILTNFSFLFLLLVFVLLVFITVYNLYIRHDNNKLNFNTKIQLYLNFAFFLPLIVVSIIIVTILNSSNIAETKTYYLDKAQSVASDIASDLQDYYDGLLEKDELQASVSEVANITQSDMILFDTKGKLIVANQDYIYENQLMAEVVNPYAYSQIIEQSQNKTMMNETIGTLRFNSAYVSIKSLESGDVLGIVGIPFFGSKYRYEQQVIDVLSKIIQAFAFILISLLAISYISARSLTAPLRLIRQRLRIVSLEKRSEPLEYSSDDEIGLLVSEYNKMLVKLEESKEKLSKSEKESAWREMAKQVAHEIKNPLTPMKLNIQQLERIMGDADDNLKRTIRTLLNQIDTLSDIATSFSNFAEMPTPQEELFNISVSLRQSVTLHQNSKKHELTLDMPEEDCYIIGDPNHIGRVFNNLIINGIQAVPSTRKPKVKVSMHKRNKSIVFRFSDNGSGIPEDIQGKVFVPNFTTKSGGSGIGLAISKRAIEHLGGQIWFETKEDQGTAFYIEMPLANLEEQNRQVSISDEHTS